MIETAPASRDMSYDEAIIYCFLCNYNGHKDWRLPTFEEYEMYSAFNEHWYIDDVDRYFKSVYSVIPVRSTSKIIESAPMSENLMTYDDAVIYCFLCTHDGHRDWRLPARFDIENTQGIWTIQDFTMHTRLRTVPVRTVSK